MRGVPSISSPRSPAARVGAWATVLVLAVTALLGGCGADDEPDAAPSAAEDPSLREPVAAADLDRFDVPPTGMAGPGTPLGGGIEVPEGALLLGIPFPDLTGAGYRAQMLVVGDPILAYNALAEQATGLGMDQDGGCLGTGTEIGCDTTFVDRADGESLAVELRQRSTEAGVVSGLELRYRPPGSEEVGGTAPEEASAPTQPVPGVLLPDPVPAPDPADVARALRIPGSPARSVERGSELVGMAGPCVCEGDGWSFVVQVDGKVQDVIAAYARQFSDLGDPPDVSSERTGDETIYGLRVGQAPQVAEIRAIQPDDGDTYLIVTAIGT